MKVKYIGLLMLASIVLSACGNSASSNNQGSNPENSHSSFISNSSEVLNNKWNENEQTIIKNHLYNINLPYLEIEGSSVLTYDDEYDYSYSEYIFVNEKGKLFRPDYVSRHFEIVLKNNGLRKIRFHDLRHSCASMLVLQNKNMKEIQEWMGHANIATTADTYSHIAFEQKIECGNCIQEALGF